MVSAPDHLLFIYLSSVDHLEIGHWNWKLDFLLVTCIPQFSQQHKAARTFQRAREYKQCTTDTILALSRVLVHTQVRLVMDSSLKMACHGVFCKLYHISILT